MKTLAALVIGIAIGALGALFGYPIYEMRGAAMAPDCKAVVKVSLVGDQIHVVPVNACLHKGRKLTWEVMGAGNHDKVEIDFKAPEPHGPFDVKGEPRPGHYEKTGPGEIETKTAGKKGRFIYKVMWTPSGGSPITSPDPAVCVRGG
jgi:hypothetical protein